MKQYLAILLLATPTYAIDLSGEMPDPVLTPGAVRTTSRIEVCTTRTSTVRNVTNTDRAQVRRAYGLRNAFDGWCAQAGCEMDHLVPLELGGSNDHSNLFPQAYGAAHRKDLLENRLHDLVCAGAVPLTQAQSEIAKDWKAAYRKYIGDLP